LPFSFHSPPHPSGGRGDRATMQSFVAGLGQTRTEEKSTLENDLLKMKQKLQ